MFRGTPARRLTAVLALAAIMTSGCTRRASEGAPASRLIVAARQEPNSLNPLFMTGPAAAVVLPLVYSGLLTIDDRGRLQPDLAAAVPARSNGGISPDGRTITYHLRPGVRWQDGTPLTAADVVFTYQAVINPRNLVPSRYGYDAIRSVTAIDARTVRVALYRPYAPILSLFMAPDNNFGVLPRHLLKRAPDLNRVPFNEAPVGSGPYRIVQWIHGDRLRLERYDRYFGGEPHIAAIELRFVPDASTIVNQLHTNEADATFFADPAFLAQYRDTPRRRVERVAQSGFGDLLFNTQRPLAGDRDLRRAIVSALDIPRAVHDATKGAQGSADASRGLFSWAFDQLIPRPHFDPNESGRLLDAAGWRRGTGGLRQRNGRELSLELAFPSGNATASALAIEVQQALRMQGISLVLRPYAPLLFRAPASAGGPLFGGKFDLAFFEIYGTTDPDTRWYLGCTEIPPHGFNVQRYCDAAIEAAQNAGVRSYERSVRRRYSAFVQRRVASTVPFVPLYQTSGINVIPVTLHGFHASPLSPFWNVAQWTLEAPR